MLSSRSKRVPPARVSTAARAPPNVTYAVVKVHARARYPKVNPNARGREIIGTSNEAKENRVDARVAHMDRIRGGHPDYAEHRRDSAYWAWNKSVHPDADTRSDADAAPIDRIRRLAGL